MVYDRDAGVFSSVGLAVSTPEHLSGSLRQGICPFPKGNRFGRGHFCLSGRLVALCSLARTVETNDSTMRRLTARDTLPFLTVTP